MQVIARQRHEARPPDLSEERRISVSRPATRATPCSAVTSAMASFSSATPPGRCVEVGGEAEVQSLAAPPNQLGKTPAYTCCDLTDWDLCRLLGSSHGSIDRGYFGGRFDNCSKSAANLRQLRTLQLVQPCVAQRRGKMRWSFKKGLGSNLCFSFLDSFRCRSA